jgi:hypothetical protein
MDYHDYVAEGYGPEDCFPEWEEPQDIRSMCNDCANTGCECCRSCMGQNPNTELCYWAKK